MKFVRVELAEAGSHVLGQNVSKGGRRLVRKGVVLGPGEIDKLRQAQIERVYVAQLEPEDIGEEQAAIRIALALKKSSGPSVDVTPSRGGRVSIVAQHDGLWCVNSDGLLALNCIRGLSLATLPNYSRVVAGQLVATLKILPFALPAQAMAQALEQLNLAPVQVTPWLGLKVCLLVSAQAGREDKLLPAFETALAKRLAGWGEPPFLAQFVALGEEPEKALSSAIIDCLQRGADLVLLAGETATMDEQDIGPRAIRAIGGEVVAVGAPVYPGNLLLLGFREGKAIMGMPGCVRSPDNNVVDLILPRLLVGQSVTREDIARLGCGGLLRLSSEPAVKGA